MNNKRLRKAELRRKTISLAVASCFVVSNPLFANPTGPAVVNGQVTYQQAGNLLQVTNSPNAIINWQSFSIGASEITRFIQQSQASAVLNRVVGAGGTIDPSVILGALQSNGRVFLVNPNGILFGAGAQIDVAGLVATSLNLSNADFLAGRLNFTETSGAGGIFNQGTITTGAGGNVYLAGPAVANEGIIASPKGEVILAAGNSVELVSPGTPNLRVEVAASGNEARNLGQIIADSGRIGIYAGLINHGGTLRADTVEVGKNGEILLKASKSITLEPGSVISASGAPGGVHDGGTVRIVAEDTLDMQRGSAVRVDGGVDGGDGGFLELSGKQQIALNGEFTGSARKDGYKHGALLLDPLNINIGANGLILSLALPAHSGTGVGKMLVSPDGTRAYIVRAEFSFNSSYIDVVDLATNTVIASVPVFGGTDTIADMAFSPDGNRLYALSFNPGGSIYVVDTDPVSQTYNTVLVSHGAGTFASSANPRAIAVSPDGTKLYTAHQNFVCSTCPAPPARVSVIDANTGGELTFVEVAGFPTQLLTNPVSQRLYVFNQGQLQEINTATDTLVGSTILNGTPRSMVLSADGARLYFLFSGRTEVRDASTKAVISTLPFGGEAVAVSSGGTQVYLAGGSSVSVADLGSNSVIQTFATGGTGNSGVAFIAGANRLYATAAGTNTLAIVDLNAGSDSTTGGAVAFNASPGATLSLPVSALNGAWSAIDLAATNNVNVNAPIPNSSLDSGTTLFKLSAGNDVNIHAALGSATDRFNRDITLRAANNVNVHGSVYQSAGRALTLGANVTDAAYGMTASGTGSVNIRALGAPVAVDTLGSMAVTGHNLSILGGASAPVTVNVGGLFDASLTGDFTLQGGSAMAGNGDSVNASAMLTANAINIVAAGMITIAGGDDAEAEACCNNAGQNSTATADASATMTAATSINLDAGTGITIRGGDDAFAGACCNADGPGTGNGTADLNANAIVTAGTTLTLTAPTVTIRGGDDVYASACCNGIDGGGNGTGIATLNANASASAGSNVVVNSTTLTVRGGDFAEASACCNGSSGIGIGIGNVTTSANALLSAGNDLTINTATLDVRGGNSAEASACCTGADGGVAGTATVTTNARAMVAASQDIVINATGAVTVAGGNNASGSACCNGSSGGNGQATVNANANAEISAGRHLNLTAASLTVRGGDSAQASACCNGSSGGNGNAMVAVNSTALVNSQQNMTLNVSGPVAIRGGANADPSACCNGSGEVLGVGVASVNVDAGATVSAGGALSLGSSSLEVRGGNFAGARASSGGTNTVTVNTNAVLSAAGNMTLATTSGGVTVAGGDSAEAYASGGQPRPNTATVNANATVSSGGLLTVNSAGGLTVRGGNNASASASSDGVNTTLVNANASMLANTMALTVTGPVVIQGGNGAFAEASCCGDANTRNTSTVNANATVRAANGLTLTVNGGSVTVAGGDSARASGTEASGQYTTTTNAKGELSATAGSLAVNVSGGALTVRGGDSASASASASSNLAQVTSTAVATGKILAGGNIALTTTDGVTIRGGNYASADADGTGAGTRAIASTNADGAVAAGGSVSVDTSTLVVAGGDGARATVSDQGQNSATVTANAFLSAGTDLVLTTSGGISVGGGDSAAARVQFGSAGGANAASASAGALVSAGGAAAINAGSLTVAGGAMSSGESPIGTAIADGVGTNSAIILANANMVTAGNLSYSGGPVALLGGMVQTQGASGTANTATVEANAGIQGGGNKTFNVTGDLTIVGGEAFDTMVAPNAGVAMARAVLDPGTLDVTTSGNVAITGGTVAGAGSAYAGMMATGPINLTIGGSTGLTMTGGTPGTGPVGTGVSPITITFSGGGATAIVDTPALDGAFVNGAAVAPPPPSAIMEPPPDLPPPLNTQIHDPIFSESGQTTGASQTSDSTQQTAQTGGGDQQSSEKEDKKKSIPICR